MSLDNFIGSIGWVAVTLFIGYFFGQSYKFFIEYLRGLSYFLIFLGGAIALVYVLKLILGIGEPLIGRLLIFNALDSTFRVVKVPRDKDCPVCSQHPKITKLIDYQEFCALRAKKDCSTK